MATCCIHCGVEEGELHLSNCPELRSAFERIERQRDAARAEIERLREHHKVAVDWWMQEAQSVKPMAEEIERLNAECDSLAHQLNRCTERGKQMRRLLVWAEALIRSLSGWPEHHPSEVADWKEDWRKVREGE